MGLREKVVIYTSDPYKDMENLAKRENIDIDDLDFNLLSFTTQYKIDEKEYIKLSEKELVFFDNDENFLKPKLAIKQEYKIEIFNNFYQNILDSAVSLNANSSLTKIVAKIDFRQVEASESLALDLLKVIYKKMLKLKFYIGLRIFDFKQELIKLAKAHKKSPFKTIEQIVISKGVDAIASQDEMLIELYKEKINDTNLDEKRSGIVSVGENEVVLRHLKKKQGVAGRALNLEFIRVETAIDIKEKFSVSDAFKMIETPDYFDYVALKSGFISQNAGTYDIANLLEYNEGVEFKNIGLIKAGLHNNVKINIRLSSDLQDAVASGVKIECEELSVSGSVAGNTELSANIIKIDGTTQAKSKLYAEKEAYIRVHKGYFEGDKISIDLLENGYVKAREVRVKKALGGIIEADFVYIDECSTNNSCIFYDSAVVEKFDGQNNKFLAQTKFEGKDYELLLNILAQEEEGLRTKLMILKKHIINNKKNVEVIHEQTMKLKQNQEAIPAQYSKIMHDFNRLKMDYLKVQKEIEAVLAKKQSLKDEFKHLNERLKKAIFVNKSGIFSDMNEIKFSLFSPKQELFYATNPKERLCAICLKAQMINNEELISLDLRQNYTAKDIEWLSQSTES